MHVDRLLLLSISSHPPLVKGTINARLPTLMLVTEQVDFRIKNKYFVYIVKQERNVRRLWHSVFLLSIQNYDNLWDLSYLKYPSFQKTYTEQTYIMVYESSLVLLFIQKDEQVNTSITILTWKYLRTWWSWLSTARKV